MIYNIIVATCKNNGIGNDNKLPWGKIKEDMQLFSKLTIGKKKNAVIMGKNTYNSIGRPLKDRKNIVLSTTLNDNINNDNLIILDSIKKCIDYCDMYNFDTVWIIGGENIYNQFLKLNIVTRIYETKIYENYQCDTFFPKIPLIFNIKKIYKISNTPTCILIKWEKYIKINYFNDRNKDYQLYPYRNMF